MYRTIRVNSAGVRAANIHKNRALRLGSVQHREENALKLRHITVP